MSVYNLDKLYIPRRREYRRRPLTYEVKLGFSR
jgi:hypothetical protein